MRKLVTTYSFVASSGKITFTDYTTISLASVLLITNVTDNVVIYNFANPALGGTVATNVLTLTYSTSTMDNADKLQIWYDDALGVLVDAKSTGSWYPTYMDSLAASAQADLRVDTAGNLVTRSAILTDEGSDYEPFAGSTLSADWSIVSGAGTVISVSGSNCFLETGTTSGSQVCIYREVDYSPLDLTYSLIVSNRRANQDVYFGYGDHATDPLQDTMYARFHMSGTTSNVVLCETKSSNDSGATESTTIILPDGLVTSQNVIYRVVHDGRQIKFYIGPTFIDLHPMAIHSIQIPDPYTTMYQRVRAYNSDTVADSTTISVNTITAKNYNIVDTVSEVTGKVSINQDVVASIVNSSTTPLASGATFTGLPESTLGIAGIQVNLKTDQNCMVYVDQSQDGTNWDIIDSYNYYASIGNFGITTQATGSYLRIRVTNQNATTATSYFRLQTALCPIVEAIPRTLDSDGYLQTAVKSISDEYGFDVENTMQGELRTVIPILLAGGNIDGTTVDSNYWTTSVSVTGGGATIAQFGNKMTLTSGTSATTVSCYSPRRARYLGGRTNRYRANISVGAGQTNNTRRWGVATIANYTFTVSSANFTVGDIYSNTSQYFTVLANGTGATTLYSTGSGAPSANGILTKVQGEAGSTASITYSAYANTATPMDGAWFQIAGTTGSVVTMIGGSPTVVESGNYNGKLGATYTPVTTNLTFEIYWTNSGVIFAVGGKLLHRITVSSADWTNTNAFHVFHDSVNSDGAVSTTLNIRSAMIHGLGNHESASKTVYISGTVTAQVLKYGAGRLHTILIGDTSTNNATVTVYDQIGGANPIFVFTYIKQNANLPIMFPVHCDFHYGLSITTSAACNVTMIYE